MILSAIIICCSAETGLEVVNKVGDYIRKHINKPKENPFKYKCNNLTESELNALLVDVCPGFYHDVCENTLFSVSDRLLRNSLTEEMLDLPINTTCLKKKYQKNVVV